MGGITRYTPSQLKAVHVRMHTYLTEAQRELAGEHGVLRVRENFQRLSATV